MKDLITEYNKTVESEAPDLWARIEAGLDEIEAGQAKENATPVNNIKKFNVKKFSITLGSIAACLIVGIVGYNALSGSRSFPAADTAPAASYADSEAPNYAAEPMAEATFCYEETEAESCEEENNIDYKADSGVAAMEEASYASYYGHFMAREEGDESKFTKFVTEEGEIINIELMEGTEEEYELLLTDSETLYFISCDGEYIDEETGETVMYICFITTE